MCETLSKPNGALGGNFTEASCNIWRAKRVKVIERLDGNLAYYGLLKRSHVYQVFIDSRGSTRKPATVLLSIVRTESQRQSSQ